MLYSHHSQQDDAAKHLKTEKTRVEGSTEKTENTHIVFPKHILCDFTYLIGIYVYLQQIQNLLLQS
jgi:hypothetical protein